MPESRVAVTDDPGLSIPEIVTSGTRPASPKSGQLIYETDTDKVLKNDGTSGAPVWGEIGFTDPSHLSGFRPNIASGNNANSIIVTPGVAMLPNGTLVRSDSNLSPPSGALSASTWYHLYLYLSGGSPALELVTTAPVYYRYPGKQKTADTSRRLLHSVKTNSSGFIMRALRYDDNRVTWLEDTTTGALFFASYTGSSATSYSLSGCVPALCKRAQIHGEFFEDFNYTLAFGSSEGNYSTNASGGVGYAYFWGNSGLYTATPVVDMPLNDSQQLVVDFLTTSGSVDLFCLGYYEER